MPVPCCIMPGRWFSLVISSGLLEESERIFCTSPAGESRRLSVSSRPGKVETRALSGLGRVRDVWHMLSLSPGKLLIV